MAASRCAQVGAGLVLFAVAVAAPAGTAGAASKFEAAGGSELVRVGIRPDPSIVFDQPVDLGGAVAQARVNSLGVSTAYASTPFPGDAAVQLPGLTAGFSNGQINLPEYPLYVSSDYPSAPERRAQAGALSLEATSQQTGSRSTVTDGVNRSDVRVSIGAGDVVTATAETVLGYVKLGSFLSIDGLRSTASATLTPGGARQRSSALSVGALVVAGQKVGATPDQLAAIGDATSGLEGTLDQLAAQGVHISYLKPTEGEDGVTSAALAVSWTAPVPNYGTATVTALLGRTFVHVSNQPLEGSGPPSLGDVVAPPPSTSAPTDSPPPGSPREPAGLPFNAVLPGLLTGPTSTAPSTGSAPLPATALLPAVTAVAAPEVDAVAPPAEPIRGAAPPTLLLATPTALADTTPVSRLGPLLALSALALLVTVGTFRRFGLQP